MSEKKREDSETTDVRMERWFGRVALVTGASSGIGAAICRELVKQGMIVVGCAGNVQKIEDIANEGGMNGKLHAIKCDMSREEDILAMYDKIRDQFKRIDVCINNAMIAINSSLLSGNTSDWRYSHEVGIIGLCISTREAVKLMQERDIKDGQIIQMGCVAGHKIPPYQKPPENETAAWFPIHNGIKAMIRALAEGLRQELKAINSHIRVATISPGVVETQLLYRSLKKESVDGFFSNYKCLEPKDVADIVTFILKAPEYANVNDVILEPLDYIIQS